MIEHIRIMTSSVPFSFALRFLNKLYLPASPMNYESRIVAVARL